MPDQEHSAKAAKRRAGEVFIALRGGIDARKVCNRLQSRQMDTGLAILRHPDPLDHCRISLACTSHIPRIYLAHTCRWAAFILHPSSFILRSGVALVGLWGRIGVALG
jgi:hypothetical protein